MITPGQVPLDALRAVMAGGVLELPAGWEAPMRASCDALAARLAAGDTMYGVNTGFGKLASTRISDPDLVQLQLNLIRSHAAGVGEPLPEPVVRLVLALKALSLARGASAAQPSTVEALLALLNGNVLPVIPARGSVGASGDLAPLAHLSLVLIGEGQAMELGAAVPGAVALKRLGLKPLALGPKEGLALLNGTQVSTALALAGYFAAEDLWRTALVSGALSTEGARGSDTPFDPRIHALRGQEGQIRSAALLRALMAGSAIRDSHRENDPRVQDPYSLRCQPQVMGACLDTLEHVAKILAREANAVTDNPLVTEDGAVLSGGNFHAEPVGFAADHLALVLAEIGALAERRIALLVDPVLSGLPAFLVKEGGLNSGFMIAQVTAAALVAENRALATPRSVDSLPTSANQEDHVSMATGAGLRLAQMARNLTDILAIELLCGAQAVEFHRPLRSSPLLERAHALVRNVAEPWERDRQMAPDIAAVSRLIQKGGFADLCPAA
ncbi:histidine ammonia-lyase [Roseomonas gilardii subsp. gilardii]|uniref:histidine ammonia-lyase n=1 Tax=Roseomonas gilardii TaxID=257708 RepID=UPI001FF7BFA9|nr:histidine ammonia-lyase [Roseomonas gilardii]UPG71404.1 histidine ammonia-lyase [Roseomonas gilardii subsp. gilardii]